MRASDRSGAGRVARKVKCHIHTLAIHAGASRDRARLRLRLRKPGPAPVSKSDPLVPTLDFERFDVYRIAAEFAVIAEGLSQQIPRGRRALQDQLERASTSIVLNIAEGAGESSAKDKARFYRMARRSATECAAIIDLLARLALVDSEKVVEGKGLLVRVVQMLTKLSKRWEVELPGEARPRFAEPEPEPGPVTTQLGSPEHE